MKTIISTILLSIVSTITIFSQSADNLPLRLRVGAYNVGHFNMGSLGGYQEKDVKLELEDWKEWVGTQGLDILALNEWNRFFDKDSTLNAQQHILDPIYNNTYWGKENKWVYNGIATNYSLKNIRQVDWAGDYYAIVGDLQIGEKIITIMSTHIPWKEGVHLSSINKMIEEMKKYEYVICMGDMNAHDGIQLKFAESGFNIANGGYQGFFVTAPAQKRRGLKDGVNIDNIITSKNIKIIKVDAPAHHLTIKDHSPIIADVIITW